MKLFGIKKCIFVYNSDQNIRRTKIVSIPKITKQLLFLRFTCRIFWQCTYTTEKTV